MALVAIAGAGCGRSPSPAGAPRSPSASSSPAIAPSPTTTGRANAAPSRTDAVTAVRSLLATRDPGFRVARIDDVEIARDARRRWWIRADAVPKGDGQTTTLVAVGSRGRWMLAGEGADLGTSEALRQMGVPARVAGQLFPDGSLWGGYAVTGAGLTSVSATWVQPPATIAGRTFRNASFWVGIGGLNGGGVTQIGTAFDTQGGSFAAIYSYAWYELYPARPVTKLMARIDSAHQEMQIGVGDTMHASVVSLGDRRFRLTLVDETLGERFTTVRRNPQSGVLSAEIVVEGYSHDGRNYLSAFKSVRFTQCRIDGRPLNAWRPAKIEIVSGPSQRFLTRTSQVSEAGFSVTRQVP